MSFFDLSQSREKLFVTFAMDFFYCWRRLYHVGNTSFRKNTKLGQRFALGWVTIQGLDVDAVATNTVKSQKRRNGGLH